MYFHYLLYFGFDINYFPSFVVRESCGALKIERLKTEEENGDKGVKKILKVETTIEVVVDAARHHKCCSKRCLSYIHPDVREGDRMLTEYMTHWFNMSPAEHRQQFLPIVEGCVHGVTVGGHVQKK